MSGRRSAASLPVEQRTKHDINIDISFLRMSKRARQRADDLHAEFLPKLNGRFVGRDNEVELHRAETQSPSFAQAMFTHRMSGPPPACTSSDHEGGVTDM